MVKSNSRVSCPKYNYVLDIFTPHYGTDADPALIAGFDVRHGAIGPGVRASHGYERTHLDAIKSTYNLLAGYCMGSND